ncbi:MAG: hypothetical protein J6Z50_00055, partial [Fibrobacterales bacterium]|nr:hypothetical protein [Fibrobacterales bacterium]
MVHELSMLPKLGATRIAALKASGVHSVEDLVRRAPIRWIDRTRLKRIGDLREGDDAVVRAQVVSGNLVRGRMPRLVLRAEDGTGCMELVFFHYAH